ALLQILEHAGNVLRLQSRSQYRQAKSRQGGIGKTAASAEGVEEDRGGRALREVLTLVKGAPFLVNLLRLRPCSRDVRLDDGVEGVGVDLAQHLRPEVGILQS